jgi:hypothetical protein
LIVHFYPSPALYHKVGDKVGDNLTQKKSGLLTRLFLFGFFQATIEVSCVKSYTTAPIEE